MRESKGRTRLPTLRAFQAFHSLLELYLGGPWIPLNLKGLSRKSLEESKTWLVVDATARVF